MQIHAPYPRGVILTPVREWKQALGRGLKSPRRCCNRLMRLSHSRSCRCLISTASSSNSRSSWRSVWFIYLLCKCLMHSFSSETQWLSPVSHWLSRSSILSIRSRRLRIQLNGEWGSPYFRLAPHSRHLIFCCCAIVHYHQGVWIFGWVQPAQAADAG